MKSNNRVKGFNIGPVKPGRVVLKKHEDDHRRKEDEEHTQQVFNEFVATFEGDSKTRTWIKGGVVNPTNESTSTDQASRLYRPTSKYEEKIAKPENLKPEAKKSTLEKPPSLGKRRGQEQKKSKLEQFKEELKLIQQQREQRHALRQAKGNTMAGQSDLDLSDIGGRGRDYRSSGGYNRGNSNSGAGNSSPAFYDRRIQRDRRDDYPYDFDGDRTTTNLFLGNLNPKMTEQQLCEAFGRYGPLASVKIMWPRTEGERARGRNCGFVAFMNRQDGERALENIRGRAFMGFEMKLGWGKSVPIPLYPIYIPPTLLELVKPPPPSGLPFNAQPREWLKSVRLAIKERAKLVTDGADPEALLPPGPDRKPFDIKNMSEEEVAEVLKDAVVKVVIPSDRSILALIHRLIEFVILEGPQFEAAIMHREQNNPQFKFLFDYQSFEHTYYRWKLWSILHGESVNSWQTEEFHMFEGGPLWRPPPMNLFSGGMPEDLVEDADYPYAPGYVPPFQTKFGRDSDDMNDDSHSEAMAISRRCGLTDAQRGRFTQMLSDLEPCRTLIGDLMFWCLEHADSASDISDCILESISSLSTTNESTSIDEIPKTNDADAEASVGDNPETSKESAALPISKTVARLFLVSDILYNSSAKVPNASYFRKCFESRLPQLFNLLHFQYKNAEGKLKAEQLKQKVMLCFRAWEEWTIYPNEYLIKLQNIFLGLVSDVNDEAELAGVPLELNTTTGGATLDPSAFKLTAIEPDVEVLAGQPLVQYDGDPLDVDGSPLEKEYSDEALTATHSKPPTTTVDFESKSKKTANSESASNRLFVPSKWETVDPETVESEAVTTTNRWELLVDSTPQQTNDHGKTMKKGSLTGDRWSVSYGDSGANDDELDGQPLNNFSSLVAYDDEDANSPVSDETDLPVTSKPLVSTAGSTTPLTPQPPTGVPVSNTISEERRTQLREIELKVVKYQDELEANRKGDSSISEEAINKQIQRYRERLLERLNEDAQFVPTAKKSSKASSTKSKSKTAKSSSKEKSANTRSPAKHHTSTTRHSQVRDHSFSPVVRRDSRDRSPPRSFRDRDRPVRTDTPSSECDDETELYNSPTSRTSRSAHEDIGDSVQYDELSYSRPDAQRSTSSTWDSDVGRENRPYSSSNIRSERALDELEEGEASDEEEPGLSSNAVSYSHRSSKRRRTCDEDRNSVTPRSGRKRYRSRSPNTSPPALRHSQRSRTPSPNRRRTSAADNKSKRK